MRRLGVGLASLALAACVALPPSPRPPGPPGSREAPSQASTTATARPNADDASAPADYEAAPPPAISASLAGVRIGFVPLTVGELELVTIPVEVAERTALAIGPQPYGAAGGVVVWKRVGCVLLGRYTAPRMPSIGDSPATFPAWLVQVIGDPVPDWPGINVDVVVVDATTGARGTIYGQGPSAIMGTTCGVPWELP